MFRKFFLTNYVCNLLCACVQVHNDAIYLCAIAMLDVFEERDRTEMSLKTQCIEKAAHDANFTLFVT